jgi:hypothetical protein
LHTDGYAQTLHEFRVWSPSSRSPARASFFLLLGYWTDVSQMMSVEAWLISVSGIALILASRFVILKLLRQEAIAQLVWIAPRGPRHGAAVPERPQYRPARRLPVWRGVMLVVLATLRETALSHRGAAHAAEGPRDRASVLGDLTIRSSVRTMAAPRGAASIIHGAFPPVQEAPCRMFSILRVCPTTRPTLPRSMNSKT